LNYRDRFSWNFHKFRGENPSSLAELFHATNGQKDRRTDITKLIIVFRSFAKAPKTAKVHLEYIKFVPPKEQSVLRLVGTTREGKKITFLLGTCATNSTQLGVK
jgi:hypothetical protein